MLDSQAEMRKLPEEGDWKAVFGKTERTVVCPEKAGVFSGNQSRLSKSQRLSSLDSGAEGD